MRNHCIDTAAEVWKEGDLVMARFPFFCGVIYLSPEGISEGINDRIDIKMIWWLWNFVKNSQISWLI